MVVCEKTSLAGGCREEQTCKAKLVSGDLMTPRTLTPVRALYVTCLFQAPLFKSKAVIRTILGNYSTQYVFVAIIQINRIEQRPPFTLRRCDDPR